MISIFICEIPSNHICLGKNVFLFYLIHIIIFFLTFLLKVKQKRNLCCKIRGRPFLGISSHHDSTLHTHNWIESYVRDRIDLKLGESSTIFIPWEITWSTIVLVSNDCYCVCVSGFLFSFCVSSKSAIEIIYSFLKWFAFFGLLLEVLYQKLKTIHVSLSHVPVCTWHTLWTYTIIGGHIRYYFIFARYCPKRKALFSVHDVYHF